MEIKDRVYSPAATPEECGQCGAITQTFLVSNDWNSWRRCRDCLVMFRDLLTKALDRRTNDVP